MGRKSKVFDDLKIEVVENYLNSIKGVTQICFELIISKKSFQQWVRNID